MSDTARERRFEIRSDLTQDDLVEIEAIQREIWGPDDVVPPPHLRAVEHSGGQIAAAYSDGRMIGFSYGFLAAAHGRGMEGYGLHSHMVAVRSSGRGLGVGQALKWHQRSWALERGLSWVSWTFDPLQARNARLNLEHLGALVFDYLVDFYGPMEGPLGGGQNSDRLLAVWRLGSARVRRLAEAGEGAYLEEAPERRRNLILQNGPSAATQDGSSGGTAPEQGASPPTASEAWGVRATDRSLEAEPLIASVPDEAETVRVAVPLDVTRLLVENPELVRRWRGAVGVTMSRLLERGYVVTGFDDGAYIIKRDFHE